MALTAIGAITLTHFDPQFSWSSTPTSRAGRGATISGMVEWTQADQLSELIANPNRQTTIGGVTGVLEFVNFSDSLLASKTGWYLLQDFEQSPSQKHSVGASPVPISISAVFIGVGADVAEDEEILDGGAP